MTVRPCKNSIEAYILTGTESVWLHSKLRESVLTGATEPILFPTQATTGQRLGGRFRWRISTRSSTLAILARRNGPFGPIRARCFFDRLRGAYLVERDGLLSLNGLEETQ